MKFLMLATGVVHVDQRTTRQCYNDSLKTPAPRLEKGTSNQAPYHNVNMVELEPRSEHPNSRPQATEELHFVADECGYGKKVFKKVADVRGLYRHE